MVSSGTTAAKHRTAKNTAFRLIEASLAVHFAGKTQTWDPLINNTA
jgi:hypothetical protein